MALLGEIAMYVAFFILGIVLALIWLKLMGF